MVAFPDWRFFLYDLRTRLLTAELPVIDGSCTFSDVLNAPGAAKFSIPLYGPSARTVTPLLDGDGFPFLDENGNVIFLEGVSSAGVVLTPELLAPPNAGFAVEVGGLIRWAGPIVTHPSYDFEAGKVDFGCEGIWSYVRRRVARNDHSFVPATASSANNWVPIADNFVGWRDPNIARHLLDTMQLWGTFGIDTGDPVSFGSFTELAVHSYERRYVAEIIEQNAATEGGYDFRIEPSWTAGPNSQITYLWKPSFPATGRRTELLWDPASTRMLSASIDPTNIAYTVHVTGQGTGESMPVVTVADQALIDVNLLLEDTESASNVIELPTLERHALRRLRRGSAPVVSPELELPVSELGTFIVGDQVRVRFVEGLFSVDEWFRVTAYEVDVTVGTMKVTLAPSSLFGD